MIIYLTQYVIYVVLVVVFLLWRCSFFTGQDFESLFEDNFFFLKPQKQIKKSIIETI